MSSGEPSLTEILGLSEEQQGEWCLLRVSRTGHPTYTCPICFKPHVTVATAGAELPAACATCGRLLVPPRLVLGYARTLLIQGGHQNLIGREPTSRTPS